MILPLYNDRAQNRGHHTGQIVAIENQANAKNGAHFHYAASPNDRDWWKNLLKYWLYSVWRNVDKYIQ